MTGAFRHGVATSLYTVSRWLQRGSDVFDDAARALVRRWRLP